MDTVHGQSTWTQYEAATPTPEQTTVDRKIQKITGDG